MGAGLLQRALADAVGMDNYLGMVEQEERNPANVNIVNFAEALGVPPGELFRDFR